MSSVGEIVAAISRLNRQDFAKFSAWFDSQRNRLWDEQITTDSNAGALDFLLNEVEAEIAQGKTRPTDELCDNA